MEKIKGTITNKLKTEGVSKTNGKPYIRYEFTINDLKYSTFDIAIGEFFKEGMTVEMTVEQKGKFWNMNKMELVSSTNKTATIVNDHFELPEVVRLGEIDKQRLIVRQCVLKCATELCCTHPESSRKDMVSAITENAKKFEEWVYS